jgi:hypothetical protein
VATQGMGRLRSARLAQEAQGAGSRLARRAHSGSGCIKDFPIPLQPIMAIRVSSDEVAPAKAERAKGRDDDELQQLTHCSSSGNLAMFAAVPAPHRRIWNKISERAFVFEDHRILGGGYEALAILIGNLLGHRLRLTHRQVGSLSLKC